MTPLAYSRVDLHDWKLRFASLRFRGRLFIVTGIDKQLDYYRCTASQYADLHVAPGDEHFIALEYALALMPMAAATSVLDVGAGTGRAVRFLQSRRPELRIVGLEPSDSLRRQAEAQGGNYVAGTGEALPFRSKSFDVVLATGVLHHIARPAPVVAEMMRVARTAVMISDSNRFGQGPASARALKIAIYRTGLWPIFEKIRTRGKGYMESHSDGIFYSYSIFDSLPQLASWADRSFVIPTGGQSNGRWLCPISSSTHGFLVALKEPQGGGWAGSG